MAEAAAAAVRAGAAASAAAQWKRNYINRSAMEHDEIHNEMDFRLKLVRETRDDGIILQQNKHIIGSIQ